MKVKNKNICLDINRMNMYVELYQNTDFAIFKVESLP